MLRKAIAGIMIVCFTLVVAPVFAQESMHGSHSTQSMSEGTATGKIDYFIAVVVSAAVAMMIASTLSLSPFSTRIWYLPFDRATFTARAFSTRSPRNLSTQRSTKT